MRRGHGPNIIASFRLIGCWRLPPTTIQMPHNNRKHLIINKQARELGFRVKGRLQLRPSFFES